MSSWNKRIKRLCRAFPSRLRLFMPDNKIPIEVFNKLKPMPSFEKYYDPDVPRIEWIAPWQKEVEEALEHNEKILKSLNLGD